VKGSRHRKLKLASQGGAARGVLRACWGRGNFQRKKGFLHFRAFVMNALGDPEIHEGKPAEVKVFEGSSGKFRLKLCREGKPPPWGSSSPQNSPEKKMKPMGTPEKSHSISGISSPSSGRRYLPFWQAPRISAKAAVPYSGKMRGEAARGGQKGANYVALEDTSAGNRRNPVILSR